MARTHKAANMAAARDMAAISADEKLAKFTGDSFQNFLAKVGLDTSNPTAGSTYGFDPIGRLRLLLEWMYRGSWLVGQVVDCVAEDMTRAGIELSSDIDPDQSGKILAEMRDLAIWERLNSTVKWSRLYGGALAFLMIDGQKPETPFRLETVRPDGFKGIMVLDRWMVTPSLSQLNTELGPDIGLPIFYDIVAAAPGLPRMRIHYSRLIRLDGLELPYYQRLSENLWGLSFIERLYDRMVAFDSTTQGTAQLVYKAHLRVISIEGLRELISAGGKMMDAVTAQLNMIRRFQTNEGMTVLDAKDKYEAFNYSFSGLADVLMQFGQQLSGASGIPLVRLFGQSPAGLSSTGESDLRNYYDMIAAQQRSRLGRGVRKIIELIAQSKKVALPAEWDFKFSSLWQLSDTEKAEIAGKVGTAVGDAFDKGIIGRQTALSELKQSSRITGIFTSITDEQIEEADEDPPDPVEMAAAMAEATGPEPGAEGDDGAPAAKPKPAAKPADADE